jgi:aspartate aminotransferase-like enzyme
LHANTHTNKQIKLQTIKETNYLQQRFLIPAGAQTIFGASFASFIGLENWFLHMESGGFSARWGRVTSALDVRCVRARDELHELPLGECRGLILKELNK